MGNLVFGIVAGVVLIALLASPVVRAIIVLAFRHPRSRALIEDYGEGHVVVHVEDEKPKRPTAFPA